MRSLWLCLALCSFASAARRQEAPRRLQSVPAAFEISGRVQPYHPEASNGFVTFRTWEISGALKDTAVLIDDKGYFQVRLSQPFAADVPMMYDGGYATLYVTPGEKIRIQINGDSWPSGDDILRHMTLEGPSAGTTRRIIDFEQRVRSADFGVDLPGRERPYKEYAAARKELMKRQLDYLASYEKRNHLSDSDFSDWCESNIVYAAGKDITFRCFSGKINRETLHGALMDLLSGIPLNNTKAMRNSAYYEFIHSLAIDFEIMVNVNDHFKPIIKKQGNNRLPVFLMEVDRYAKGFARQLMYYSIYASNRGRPFVPAPFEKVVTMPVLNGALQDKIAKSSKPFVPYDLIQKIRDYPAKDTMKQRLLNILAAQKGRYVFMDFWGIWCGPCMAEMPLYAELISHFKGQPLTFLFMAEQTDDHTIEEVKRKYKIPGNFISLTDNEVKILNNVMQFSWVPKHFLLNPKAIVVDNDASGTLGMLNTGGKLNQQAVKHIQRILP